MIKLFRLVKPYKLSVFLVLLFVFLQSLSNLYLPTLMSDIVDKGVIKGDIPYILEIGGLMLLVAILGMGCSIVASLLASKVSSGFGKILRRQVFSHVEKFALHEFDNLGTSSLITRTTNDITQVQQLLNMSLRMMVMAPLMCIGGIIMAVLTDARLSLVIVVIIPVLSLVIISVLAKGIPLFRAMQKKIDTLNRVLRENLTGIRVVRSFNRIDYEKGRFGTANLDLTDTAIKVNKIMATMMPFMMLIINFSTIAVIWFGSIRVNNGYMQVGDLMAFIQYIMQILFSIMMVSMMFFMFPRASASAARINEVLGTRPEILDVDHVKNTDNRNGFVEFQNVSFYYPGAQEPALLNISLSAKPGEVTAIIGGTGAGKSTLVNLIPRLYDVSEGKVLVDGVDVRELAQENLRSKIGYVSQKSVLFSGSIADNIRYGKENATDEEVRRAADIAQATDFISEMEDGFDSALTQGGSNLSGGQKQRLAIARALIRQPEIIIFDDSFSALDFRTDAKLRLALQNVTGNATVFIVAQRVSTVMNADRIIVLDEGRIADIGRHAELMETCEIYREIVSSQLSEEESA
jgi:ATP-binding cassette, subfamily B, multidrug efflux pump